MEKDILILREFIDVLSSDEASNKEDIQMELDIMEAQIRSIEEAGPSPFYQVQF